MIDTKSKPYRNGAQQADEANSVYNSPAIRFESITFSDGSTISLDPTDVVVLVGPNNAGKSLALRDLEEHVRRAGKTNVVKSVQLSKVGTREDFDKFVYKHAQVKSQGASWNVSGYGFSVGIGNSNLNLRAYWPNDLRYFTSLFCLRIPTETRITDSNPANAIAVPDQPVSHPIHMLYLDDHLESRMSEYFRRAFGEDLILYRVGGSKFPLLVGERLAPGPGEDRVSRAYCQRLLASTVPLEEQGDGMRSFASVILHLLAPISPSILLLDEPEAFLHPPQARLLGELIAQQTSSRAQLFVATHSPDVLHGLINVAPEHLRVLRMQRDGDVNRIKELDKELVKTISVDPLMKYSSVMSGVFHERVVVCESDADCMFYSSILDLPEVNGGRQPDVLFVHANGKHRMAALAKTLVALGVPVDVVADMDILNDSTVFRRVLEALGGDWAAVQPAAQAVKKAIEERKSRLNAGEIKQAIGEILEEAPATGEFPENLQSKINTLFRRASPWDAVKRAGEPALPAGQATLQFRRLHALCKSVGLWIVPVGELEGFCKSVGGHGPSWIQEIIGSRDLSNAQELEDARKFVREIWTAERN